MEIKDIFHSVSSILNTKKTNNDSLSPQSFKTILEQSKAKRMEEIGPSSSSMTGQGVENTVSAPTFQVSGPFLTEVKDLGPVHAQCIQTTEKALEILGRYQEAIADPEISLKNIYPLIQSLSQEVQGLSTLSEKLPSSDPLKEILNGVGILSTVEIERFHRGEYI